MYVQKKILITGSESYVGESLRKWLGRYGNRYLVDTVSTLDTTWEKTDFGFYDVVVHVAAIVHRQERPSMERLYLEVNRDLPIRIALRAREQGVKQFIFMSTMSVYGKIQGVIDSNTLLQPKTFYGMSKLEAERAILRMQSDGFNVVVLRPPMIYGRGATGNYSKLSKVARKCPIFPAVGNLRSMIYIDNFCEFVRLMIDNNEKGIFHPQNQEYVNTTEMVRCIAEMHGKRILTTNAFNPIIRFLLSKNDMVTKVFGDLVYDKSLSAYKKNYIYITDFRKSIELSETNGFMVGDSKC